MKNKKKQTVAVAMATALGVTAMMAPPDIYAQEDDQTSLIQEAGITIGEAENKETTKQEPVVDSTSSPEETKDTKTDVDSAQTVQQSTEPIESKAVKEPTVKSTMQTTDQGFTDPNEAFNAIEAALASYGVSNQTTEQDIYNFLQNEFVSTGKISILDAVTIRQKIDATTSSNGTITFYVNFLLSSLQCGYPITTSIPRLPAAGEIVINKTNFPDDAFREYIKTTFDIGADPDVLTLDELKNATQFGIDQFANKKSIKNLDGIELFPALQYLNCDGTGIEELDISNNTALTVLYCDNTNIDKLDVSKNSGLVTLSFSKTKIKEMNIGQKPELLDLYCYDNLEFTNLIIDQAPKLSVLNCKNTALTSLDVSNNKALTSLECTTTKIKELNVSSNKLLTDLYCNDNPNLTSLTIKGAEKLETLWFGSTQISSLDASENTNLKTLYGPINGKLNNLIVAGAGSLETLDCSYSVIEKLDVSQNANLKSLNCSGTAISSLNISSNIALTNLNCSDNFNLSTLITQGAAFLSELNCSETKIQNLDLKSNDKLEKIYCTDTPITSIDFGNNTNLSTISLPKVSLDLNITSDTFKITDHIKGIDPKNVSITNGNGTIDRDTGIVSEYVLGTPLVYSYNCGTGKNGPISLSVTLNTTKLKGKIEIIGVSDMKFTGDRYPDPKVDTGNSSGKVSIYYYRWNGTTWASQSNNPRDVGRYKVIAKLASDKLHTGDESSKEFYITKADPSFTVPNNLTAHYGQTLKDISLPKGFSWVDPSIKLDSVGNKDFFIDFTPKDTENYNTIKRIPVQVSIGKANPSYTVPTNLTASYGQTLKDISLPKGFSWTDPALSVGQAGSHEFTVVFTPADTTNYNIVSDIKVNVTIGKIDPTYTVPTNLTASYGQTLKDISLPKGFSWTNPALSVGQVGSREFTVVFTPADTTNYNTVTDIKVNVTVGKANPSFTVPTNLTASYGQTLKDISLPKGFSWTNPALSVGQAGSHEFTVFFTPTDTVNYNTVKDIKVNVTVGKVDPSYTVPTNLTASYGQKLKDISLPKGFSWTNPALSVGQAGSHEFTVFFTPADTTNYNTVKDIKVNVTVRKVDPSYTVPTNLTASYGQKLKDISLPKGFSWTDPSLSVGQVGSLEFTVVFTPADTTNYNIVSDIKVNVTVGKIDPTYTVPTNLTASYGQTLKDISLPKGFSWVDPSTKLDGIGNKDFLVNYTPDDTVNYKSLKDIKIRVTVNKASNEWIKKPELLGWTYGEVISNPDMKSKFGDVTYTYSNAKDGIYTDKIPTASGTWYRKATVKGTEYYDELEFIQVFTISPKNVLDNGQIIIPDIKNDEDVENLIIRDGDKILVKDIDYEIAKKINENKVTVTITLKGNYTGIITKSYTLKTAKPKEEPKETVGVQTGDSTRNGLFAMMGLLSAGCLAVLTGKRRKEDKK